MPLPEKDQPIHSCCETLEQIYASRQDPTEQPLGNPKENRFTDPCSFVLNGTHHAVCYSFFTLSYRGQISSFRNFCTLAALIALTRSLELGPD